MSPRLLSHHDAVRGTRNQLLNGWLVGLHPPRAIETLSELRLATARSSLPSPLKSPVATDIGFVPTLKPDVCEKLPVASPVRMRD